ncbi:hypothetical protein, partial [Pseudomonas aeruginosa]|uniref:hypothetical protein n=1 Tax=Pseudomonas aeruginosa TaxID=287 RepID=UPI001D0A5357
GHQSLLDAPLQLDQAASIQRRVTTCGGRRKTQPTVRDGLTTTLRIEEIGKGQDKVEVLIACGMKSGSLVEHVKKLEARNVAYRNAKGNLVLAEAGAGFFQDLLGEGDLVV